MTLALKTFIWLDHLVLVLVLVLGKRNNEYHFPYHNRL